MAAPLPNQLTFDSTDDAALFDAALARAASLGATIARVDIAPLLTIARRLYDGAWIAERTAALRDRVKHCPATLHPITRAILQAGLDKRTVDAFDDFHAAAEARALTRAMFADVDALLLPTAPGLPTLAEAAAEPIAANSRLGTYTNFVNLCDLAALAIPAGFRPDGRPVGLTLVGPAFTEPRLAGLGAALHHAAGLHLGALDAATPPPPPAPALAADEAPLFCIGAHMAGLPLNPQLLHHGGRFLHDALSAPLYRLHDLGNRPGLVRLPAGGTAVAGEVWALPLAALGPFLAEIPAPLGFGRVTLADGTTPLGFLCEAAGATGTPDISVSGGWRAHLVAKDRT